jgi:hypothetical protein
MTQFPTRRLAAATVLALALTVFALPAAAAPAGAWSVSSWELPTILSWFDAVWTGWFGGEEVEQPTEITSIYGKLKNASDPNGLSSNSQLSEDGETTTLRSPDGGLF